MLPFALPGNISPWHRSTANWDVQFLLTFDVVRRDDGCRALRKANWSPNRAHAHEGDRDPALSAAADAILRLTVRL